MRRTCFAYISIFESILLTNYALIHTASTTQCKFGLTLKTFFITISLQIITNSALSTDIWRQASSTSDYCIGTGFTFAIHQIILVYTN